MLVEEGQTVELLDQVEDDVRIAALDRAADDGEVAADASATDLVAEFLQRTKDVILGFSQLRVAALELAARLVR